jgi:hypothetical protein
MEPWSLIFTSRLQQSDFKPQAAEAVRKRGEKELSGNALPNAHNQCWPEPSPFVLNTQFGMEVIQQKDGIICFTSVIIRCDVC